ncbi:MAG: translational GTPase TypA [Candidatus Andersenbacteria bacterium CG10_big_fil_rev_8_21_14_0_10_54_11]|uniref:50S ribosomal subunit assembly factor BipA n=1 Tax=Candidatus Andersenbacteria bacterium CG10_big_fil_rev_8_21_14_0_10_54_11 TaxID=1974485 RepID=A0A2M6WYS0_9BACT|nr:MAG: translational GTPase TypA [Candidatus Andersenbacteria bacterium CG10_big_fil_rev_8_21_14_0_10_54_11]
MPIQSDVIRNIAIIAHVDHGKTTLVDALLRQSGSFRAAADAGDLLMDSDDLERERGITIFSKNAAVRWGDYKINIVDTPGHADFGGEVERIMSMVQGVLLLVDAKDGPMPQTKFVLRKALQAGHRVIVVINKIDVPEARPAWVLDQTFGLFVDLGATDEQADFPVLYASAVQGKAGAVPDLTELTDIRPVFEAVVTYIPAPRAAADKPLQMLVVNVAHDPFQGQIAIGPVLAGSLAKQQRVMRIMADGTQVPAKITAVLTFDGLGRVETPAAIAGDIAAVAGLAEVKIGETIADAEFPAALPVMAIDQPTVKMRFAVNTSPLAGQEGEFSTARHLKSRLSREMLSDVALKVEGEGGADSSFMVLGRGELHLSILIEKMLREGYEFQVGRPQVIFKDIDGERYEPFEDVYIECPEGAAGRVIERMGVRKGELQDMRVDRGIARLHFVAATRGLIGFRAEFLTDTRGEGIMDTIFRGYQPALAGLLTLPHGSLVAHQVGVSTLYGLLAAQERGRLFIGPGVQVYEGMIVGQNARAEDLDVNVCKEKKLTNVRSSGEGVAANFHAPAKLSLEEAIEYLGDDELLEVTPKTLRLRKTWLSKHDRKYKKS